VRHISGMEPFRRLRTMDSLGAPGLYIRSNSSLPATGHCNRDKPDRSPEPEPEPEHLGQVACFHPVHMSHTMYLSDSAIHPSTSP
jgi:hypothetical protein